jgi:putative nucleotidyltransferase with HDIG domain
VGIAVLTALLVVYLTLMDPFGIQTEAERFDFWNLMIWACFLLVTGAIVGKLQERNRLQQRQLRDAYLGIVQILTKYLEAADVDTKSHSERVAAVCSVLANGLGLPNDDVQVVWSAALLHDIGKIEVIDLVRRAAELTPEERARIDTHTELGARVILTTGSILEEVVPAVIDHHRRYDDGGEAIPLGARIIRVADTYDAIVSDRPYRAGRFHWEAVEILEQGVGTQFDPQIVSVLKSRRAEVEAVYQSEVDLRGWSAVQSGN